MASKQVVLSAALATAAAVVLAPRAASALRRLLLGPCACQGFSLACCCGRVRAAVRAPAPLHLVCHCDDCGAYVTWASRRGAAPCDRRLLEPDGGVRTVQVFKSDITVQSGAQSLAVTRLAPDLVPPDRPFVLLRVHASCCGTPLFNTWHELPTCSFFASAAAADGGSGAAALAQPPQWRLNTAWAQPGSLPPPAGSAAFGPLFLMRFIARNLYFRSRGVAPFELPPLSACATWRPEEERGAQASVQ